jgi:hypothetical protein
LTSTARRFVSGIVPAAVFIIIAPCASMAETAPVLYHTTADTFGCSEPGATRALTDPTESRRANPAWFKSVFNDGHCVSITPKSPWRLVSRSGDVALMDYAGTIGPPGTYYLRVDQLVDGTGAQPSDAPSPQSETSTTPAAIDTSSPTALTPTAPTQLASPQQPEHASWSTTDILLLLGALILAAAGGFVLGRRSSLIKQ